MSKKIIISLSAISVVAALGVIGTVAFFSDTETSTGNILIAGTMDLKVDHTRQTYNDVDCKTCSVEVKSDTSNIVVSTSGGDDPVPFPHAAVAVSNPHPAWTVTGDIPGATWIWATDPTTPHDSGNVDVYYTFQKKFVWWGPATGITLSLGVGADNGYEVKLNGNVVGTDWTEYNYRSPADTYSGFGSYLVQGENTLEITVKNKALPGGTPAGNPAGLLYKLAINGNCGEDYFRQNCQLWGLKDLAPGDKFWDFDDIKPGDHGTNVISLHAYNNNAYACLSTSDIVDLDNTLAEPEVALSDTLANGELSPFIKIFAWQDDGDGNYEGEAVLLGPNVPLTPGTIGRVELPESQTQYIGIAWCAGTQGVPGNPIACDGSSMGNIAQTDSFTASLTAYAEQQRNNGDFRCPVIPN